jgi:hypothetical protein
MVYLCELSPESEFEKFCCMKIETIQVQEAMHVSLTTVTNNFSAYLVAVKALFDYYV